MADSCPGMLRLPPKMHCVGALLDAGANVRCAPDGRKLRQIGLLQAYQQHLAAHYQGPLQDVPPLYLAAQPGMPPQMQQAYQVAEHH